MIVHNLHQRFLAAPPDAVARLIDSLSSPEDALWPRQHWPRMRLDRPLGIGATGGHGPIGYVVERYVPGHSVVFRFTAPSGFDGTHGYEVRAVTGGTLLVHVLEMTTSGLAVVTWPLVFRPMHDALVEDSLDRAESAMAGRLANDPRWSRYVQMLRYTARLLMGRRVPVRPDAS